MAKLFLEGTIDVYGMNSSYYQPYHLNYVMWQKLWSGGRSWIWLWIRKKKQWLGLYEIEKLFHAVSGTYTPRFRMSSISIESIEMVTEIIQFSHSFVLLFVLRKELNDFFLQKWPYEYWSVRRRTNALIKTI